MNDEEAFARWFDNSRAPAADFLSNAVEAAP
jgi:hypothetical protein